MKKNISHILIAILIVLQAASILKINNLQRQIESTNAEMNHFNNSIRSDMNAVYSNVDEMLNQKASLIESAATEIGTLNADDLTVPVTFTLTPKEVSEYTAVSLDFDGELFPMEKNGTTFFATVSRNVFDHALPKIVIDENGIKKIMQDDQVGIPSIKESIFPIMHPSLSGEARFDGKTYKRKGSLNTDTKETASGIKFTKIRFAVKVDDKVISNEMIPNETLSYGYEVDEEISLSNGQICTMTVIATDSIGFEHHYIVGHYVAGSDKQREPWFGDEQIYSADGKLLWKPGN
ncbi:MAG TPA: hypothetical protein VN381_17030 [Anaerovoracaceae bacterium]|nr:hypothetical protein [Anaerovoracaceae bacterium]